MVGGVRRVVSVWVCRRVVSIWAGRTGGDVVSRTMRVVSRTARVVSTRAAVSVRVIARSATIMVSDGWTAGDSCVVAVGWLPKYRAGWNGIVNSNPQR